MSTVTVTSVTGAEKGSVELADELFGIEPNVAVMHQVVTAPRAGLGAVGPGRRRQGHGRRRLGHRRAQDEAG